MTHREVLYASLFNEHVGIAKGDGELLLIRHAVTDMAGRLCGHSDPSLNAVGREQANALAYLLRGYNVSRLYSSDLQRAVQTAQPLSESWGIPILQQPDLREIAFGSWEGKRWSDISTENPEAAAFEASGLSAPDGEPSIQFSDRVVGRVKQIAAESSKEIAALVTHLGVLRVVLARLCQANKVWDPKARMDYCAVYRIQITGTAFELIEELKTESNV